MSVRDRSKSTKGAGAGYTAKGPKGASAELPEETTSLWSATAEDERFPRQDKDVTVDVAIVGGGITAVTAALKLKGAGMTVAILEAERVGRGVTGYTTAHLTEAIDTRYHTLIKDFGESGARIAREASRAAIDQIEQFGMHHDLDCDFVRVPGYLYTEREEDLGELEKELDAAKRVGCQVEMVREVPLPFPVAGAIRFDDQAQFHVLKYLLPLAKLIPGDGSHVFEQTRVVGLEEGSPCRVITAHGEVRANYVIVAAHAPANTRFALQTKLAHYRSYAIAVTAKSKVGRALFWDTEDPYHYTRHQQVDGRDVLIIGGEDHKTGQKDDTDACYEKLLAYAKSRYEVQEVLHRWSAQVIEPVDGLPFVGRSPFSTRVFVATGYSGNGMTFGTMAGMLLADTVAGRENPWKGVFEATRIKPAASVADFVMENVDYPLHLIGDRLKGPDATSLDEVAKGEGKLVALGGKKLAVYRDDDDGVHALSPVCTHMGCLVHFNHAEKTWDCPCHGSRFDAKDGHVLDGPAVTALAKQDVKSEGEGEKK